MNNQMKALTLDIHNNLALIAGWLTTLFLGFWDDLAMRTLNITIADPLAALSHVLSIALSIVMLRKIIVERRRKK